MASPNTVAVVTALESVLYELSPSCHDLLNALVFIYERGAVATIVQNDPEHWPEMVDHLKRQLDSLIREIEGRLVAEMPVVVARSGRAN